MSQKADEANACPIFPAYQDSIHFIFTLQGQPIFSGDEKDHEL